MSCKSNLKYFLFNIDIFGKEVKIYYKGKSKFKTLLGSFSTIIYGIIYILLFAYKLNMMLKKEDVNYYETNVNTEGNPYIELTNEIFYPIISLGNIDLEANNIEMLYSIKALFWNGKKIKGKWSYNSKNLELEQCKIVNFAQKYREKFKDIEHIENYYCIKNINDLFVGNHNSNNDTYLEISFYPCINDIENSTKCYPSDTIKHILDNNYIEILFPDVELSPQIYKAPVQFGKRGTSFQISEKLKYNLNLYFHKINIETDEDNLGLSKIIKKESYLALESYQIISSLNNDSPFISGKPIASIYILLSDKIMTVKRTYTKLIDILGSIGGIMGVIYSFFQIIISFLTDILYDISLVNHLFAVDSDKNNLIFKNIRKNINGNFGQDENPEEFNLKNKSIDKSSEMKKFKNKMYKIKVNKVYNFMRFMIIVIRKKI